MAYSLCLLFVLILRLPSALANSQDTITQTMTNVKAWQDLDLCARNCFQSWELGCWIASLDTTIGCGDSNICSELAINGCYCRTDKQSVATSYLSLCVSSACTVGDPQVDINSAVGIYTGYCAGLGYEVVTGLPASVAATTTPSTNQGPTQTVYVTKTTSGSKRSLSTCYFICLAQAILTVGEFSAVIDLVTPEPAISEKIAVYH